jgi:hypothetical protein
MTWAARNYGGFVDELGVPYGVKHVNNKPRVSAMSYLHDIAEGNVSGHTAWSKIGFNGALVADTEADLWSATGVYAFPAAAMAMQVKSSYATANATRDIGTVIFGNVEGADQTIIADAGSTAISLYDADVNFGGGTAVAVGDCILLDPKGTTPEWGYVTSIADAATGTLGVAGGFSAGGAPYQNAAGRAYTIIDKSEYSGAHAVKIEYLTSAYATKSILVVLNGNTGVNTENAAGTALSDLYRIQSFRVIATGSGNKPTGNLTLTDTTPTVTYSYISAGFTRARNAAYTVPAGKTLYVVQFAVAYGYKTNSTHYCRLYTRANMEAATGFNTGNIFYPFTEIICSNSSQMVELDVPTKLTQKTDIKVSALATYAGAASVALRGWLE